MTIDTTSIPIAAGAATIVERRPAPAILNPIAVTPKQLSMTPLILIPLLHFVLSLFRLSHSAINISCISSIFLRRYICALLHFINFHFFSEYNIFF